MARPLTRAQAMQNAAFLLLLRRTGNIRLAARELGVAPATLFHRRKHHPAFAQQWDVAVTMASARLARAGGCSGPKARRPATDAAPNAAPDTAPDTAHRTAGGEPVVVRRRDGKLQVRRAQPNKLTRQCEQAFLLALSATADVSLAAAAAGAAEAAFYRRRRRNAGFAREMRLALQQGYERLEMALLASSAPGSHADDAWRHNEPPEMPAMTANQMLQLLYLHQKEARLQAEPAHIRRRPGETREAHAFRLGEMYEARLQRAREAFDVAEAARRATGEPSPFEPPAPVLPALDQVTGWSKADPAKVPHDPGRALFGGWRVEEMKKRGS